MPAISAAIAGGQESAACPAGRLDEELDRLLRRVTDVWQSCLAPLLQAQGLSEPRYQILAALFRRMPTGCSQIELAGELFQSESNLSTLLERMQADGLVLRQRSPIDRRKVTIQLSESGAAALAAALTRRQQQLGRILYGFDLNRRQDLVAGLQLLLNCLSRQRHRSSGPPDPQPSITAAPRPNTGRLDRTSSNAATPLAEHNAS
jgi:DNA-binding MarR family transcriptional regulator